MNADYADLSQDPLVLCPSTTKFNAADVELSQDRSVLWPVTSSNVVDLTHDLLGPHLSQAHVQSSVPPSTT